MNNIKEIPIHKFVEAKMLIAMDNRVCRIEHNKHNSSKIVFYFNGTEKFFKDWNYIKENK